MVRKRTRRVVWKRGRMYPDRMEQRKGKGGQGKAGSTGRDRGCFVCGGPHMAKECPHRKEKLVGGVASDPRSSAADSSGDGSVAGAMAMQTLIEDVGEGWVTAVFDKYCTNMSGSVAAVAKNPLKMRWWTVERQ